MFEQKRQKIMLVDDNMANLKIGKTMLKDFYEVYALPSADRLFSALEHVIPDLILLDIEMPAMSGYDVIKILKANERCADIPVVFVTSRNGEMDELEGLALGAVDYVTKPFSTAILLKRIENQLLIRRQKAELKDLNENLMKMVKEQTQQIIGLQNSILSTVADLVEFRDDITGGHVTRTQKYVEMLFDQLVEDSVYSDEVLSLENMDYLLLSAQLHDVGKLSISDAILNKPGKLSPEEFEIMKTHVTKGVEVIERMEKQDGKNAYFLKYAKTFAGTHHEKWDGSGYPQGLKGKAIPIEGRIMAIADVYDALISVRPYKEPLSCEKSAQIIIEGAGSHFDPALITLFKKLTSEFSFIAGEYNDSLIEKFLSGKNTAETTENPAHTSAVE